MSQSVSSVSIPSFVNSTQFTRFSIERLIDNSVTDFDLFLDVKSHLILYSGKGYKWSKAELESLINQGHLFFWMKSEDHERAFLYEKMSQLPTVSKQLAPHERLQSIQDIGAAFTRYLYEGEITESVSRKAEELADSIVDCIEEDRGCISSITGLANHDMYTYLHSVRVSAYATAIAAQMGLSRRDDLRNIALGAIFHDVGKSAVPITIINKSGPLLHHEWEKMKSHPIEGLKKIENTILNHVSREIVLHHHERLNGSGYPDALTEDSLLQEVQIAALADIYDALTSSRSYQNKRTRFEALDFIKSKLLKSDVSTESFKALIECLARPTK
jgi:putative nucleotidyltransferase with HDIG domain